MRMETTYWVQANSEEAIDKIIQLWGYEFERDDDFYFEEECTNVYDVMEKVIKVVREMEIDGQKENFNIVGICDTDYDCTVFTIEYSGNEPMIKASHADPDDEDRYEKFYDTSFDEIPGLLKRNKARTFKQAIKDELPLGGFLEMSYEEWVKSILDE